MTEMKDEIRSVLRAHRKLRPRDADSFAFNQLDSITNSINAIFANSFDDISIVPNFVLTPLVYLGGVFYSVNLLPDFWRKVSLGNPILYMVNAFRYGFLGVSDMPIGSSLLLIAGVVLVLGLWALWLLERGTRLKG
jgi:ABC-2 type transport system permease protein